VKTTIECEDSIEVIVGKGKARSSEVFYVSVTNEFPYSENGELALHFRGYSSDIASVPSKYWPELKDKVDRLIIKAEHLIKEDC
jgi:hypothetical protein